MKRSDGRSAKDLRPVKITRNYLKYPEGSVLIEMGNTKVICTASISETVPPHKKNSGSGWVTAEYSMLPRSTAQRSTREHLNGKTRGRTQEIQRLIGRSLRAVIDLNKLGERSLLIDCDVIQADGGTRTASVTGAWIALHDAIKFLLKEKKIISNPISEHLAAVSVGIVDDKVWLDLPYEEDLKASVDMNIVMTESGNFIEVQGTAEHEPFSKAQLDQMLELAKAGIRELIAKQKEVVGQ